MALSNDRRTVREVAPERRLETISNIKADTRFYEGAIVGYDSSGEFGPAENESNFRPIGILVEKGFQSGTTVVRQSVVFSRGEVWIRFDNPTEALLGDEWYASDDNTIVTTAPSGAPLPGGIILGIDRNRNEILIDFNPRS